VSERKWDLQAAVNAFKSSKVKRNLVFVEVKMAHVKFNLYNITF